MCNKNSTPPPDMQTRSMTKKKKARETLKPARKTRTKTRKPKFLSLRLELSSVSDTSQNSTQMTPHHKTHTLFPLHPENLVEDKDIHDENVALLFNTDSAATLNGLLAGVSSSDEDSLSPPSLTYPYGGHDSKEGGGNSASSKLVRTAMKNKERDASEEKWVCYSEVVEKKELEEVTSCAADVRCMKRTQGSLSLKLDYQGILNAWSDQAPLYLEGESPQTVPELHDEFLTHDGANVLMDGWGSAGDIWRVPEMGSNGTGSMKMEEMEGKDVWKMKHRQASVLRYKEKRQNRLFSKRVRYEVRKLNAEKRPRMKGRFVKRS